MTAVEVIETAAEGESDVRSPFDQVCDIVEQTWEEQMPERYALLKILIEEYEGKDNRFSTAPASGKEHYHLARPGGFCDHILHVYQNALTLTAQLRREGGLTDFTRSELTLSALMHDLYKLGMPDGEPYYLEETSQWHREHQGARYKRNEKLPYMSVPDGSLFILQEYGIALTQNEWLAIKLHDGLYDESNRKYLNNNHHMFPIRTNLVHILHMADHLSTIIERDPVRQAFMIDIAND